MKLYNSMTGRKEEFIPLDGKNVKMYACGITVYDLSHIGHARQAIAYAMVADYLRYRGYNVKYVRNYTGSRRRFARWWRCFCVSKNQRNQC